MTTTQGVMPRMLEWELEYHFVMEISTIDSALDGTSEPFYFCLPTTKGSPSSGFRLSGAYNLTAATRPVSSKLPNPTLPHSKVLSTARMIGLSKSFTKTSIFPVEYSRTKRKSCHSLLLHLCPCDVLCEILVLGLPFTTKQL